MPGWEPFFMGGTSTWPLAAVVAPVSVSATSFEVVAVAMAAEEN